MEGLQTVFTMKRILLVGGAGFIGSPLTGYLLQRGYYVRCMDMLLYDNYQAVVPYLGHPNYDFVRADMGESADLAMSGITDVVILAGLVGDPITTKLKDAHNYINVYEVGKFIDELRNVESAIFVSTCSNYGDVPADMLALEWQDLKPLSPYAKAKVEAEKLILKCASARGYCATVLRFATAFGVSGRMRFDLTVNEFTRELYCGDNLVVYDADTWRPYCHVYDFARAIAMVLEAPRARVESEIFNVGGDENNHTKREIAELIQNKLMKRSVSYVEGGKDRRNYRVDFGKIRSILDFKPTRSVEDGVDELIGALRNGFFSDYDQRRTFYRNEEIVCP